jgi:putative methyltransferase (TIGR04325 family)
MILREQGISSRPGVSGQDAVRRALRVVRGALWGSQYRGKYATFEDAEKAAPRSRKLSYDNAEAANLFLDDVRLQRIKPSDYPTIYWLEKTLKPGSRVFDWGGNIGRSFYPYQRYIDYPDDLEWIVCDVPAVTRAGAELARRNNTTALKFTERPEECDGCDILIAFGSLQFINTPLDRLLSGLRNRPKHLLINRTPVHTTRSFYTLQDIGPAVCAYHVFSEAELIKPLEACGYQLQDRWACHGSTVRIRFHPDDAVEQYSGYYFKSVI